MKRLVVGFLILVVALVAAALIAPGFVDWTRFKPEIAAEVEKATGRRLTIEGDLDATLLPAPALIAGNVRLANLPGARTPDFARLDSLRINIALLPLLSGRIEVTSVRLVRPVVALEVLADGRRNWIFMDPSKAQSAPGPKPGPKPGPESGPAPDASGGGAPAVAIAAVRIEGGAVTYRDARSGLSERIEAIDVTLGAESLAGPFRGDGRLRARGQTLEFDGTLGRIGAQAAPARLRLRLREADTRLTLAGEARLDGKRPGFTGKIEIVADALDRLVRVLAPAAANLPDSRFRLEGLIEAGETRVALDDMAVTLGEADIFGAASVTMGTPVRADLVLTAGRLDVDPWLDALAKPAPTPSPKAAAKENLAGAAKEDRPTPAPGGFALPPDLAVNLDLSVEALVHRERAFSDVRFNAVLEDGRLRVARASARLPGDGAVAASGTLAAEAGTPRFRGRIEAGADNLRGVLTAFAALPDGVSANRLRKFDLRTDIDAIPTQIDLTDLTVGLDVSRMTGALTLVPGPRLAFGARLRLNALDLDAYLPAAARAKAPAGKPSAAKSAGGNGSDKAARIRPSVDPDALMAGKGMAALNEFDANLDLRIERLSYAGQRARDLRFDGTLQGGALTMRDFSIADLAGAGVLIKGTAQALDTKPVLDLTVAASAADTAGLFRLSGVAPPILPRDIGAVAIDARLKGGLDGLDLDLRSKLMGGSLTLTGRAAPGRGFGDSRLAFTAAHPEAKRLLALLAPNYRPAGAKLGKLDLAGALEARGDGYRLAGLRAAIGAASVTGEADLALVGARPKLTAKFTAGEMRIDPFLPAPGGGGRKSGAAPAPAAKGTAAGRRASGPAAAVGGAPWSSDPIDLAFLRDFDAEVALAAKALLYMDYRLDAAETRLALAGGVLEAKRVSGKMVGGDFNLTGRLDARRVPAATANLKVAGMSVREALMRAGDIGVVEGIVEIDADVKGAGASERALVSSLAGTARIAVADGAVTGFSLKQVSDRLKRLDQPLDFLRLLQSALAGGQTRFTALSGNVAIDKGVLTSSDLSLAAEAGAGRATAVVDLPRWSIDLDAEFRLTEHPDAPPIGMRLDGPIDAPRQVFDLNRLQAYLVARGLGSLFGGKKPASEGQAAPSGQTAPPQTGQPEKVKPEDILRDILKGLGKKK